MGRTAETREFVMAWSRERFREFYKDNRERIRARSKVANAKRRDKKKAYDRERRILHGEALREYDRNRYAHRRLEVERLLLGRAKQRAKKKDLPFNITKEDVIVPELCPVFGIRLEVGDGSGGKPNSPSLDRIIPELGYVKGNVVVISQKANQIKAYASSSDIRRVADWLDQVLAKKSQKSV